MDVAQKSIPCGTYYVVFNIDHLGQVTERYENDNVFYWSTPTVVIPCVPNLDLATGTSSLSITGTTVSLALTVVNNGSATAGASTLGYYLSPDPNLTTTPNYLIGTDAIPALAIGVTSAQTLTMDVAMSSVPCGTYYVFFNMDHLEQVTESNETDNIWYFSSPTVTIPCVPNLDLASGTSSLNVTGTSVNIGLTVINNGSAATAASELGYYLSPDASITTTPNYLIGTDAVPGLAIGETSAETYTVDVLTVTPLIPYGTYYVFFYIDHLKQVTEVNETDNNWYFSSPQVTVVQNCTQLTVTPSGHPVSSAAGSENFSITTAGTGCNWTAASNQTWCAVSPSSGSGNGTLTANFTANTTCTPRTATITVTIGELTPVNVTVTQEGCTSNYQSILNFDCNEGSDILVLTTSCTWSVSSNQTWCSISPTSGTGNKNISVNCTANSGGISRDATLTITIPGCSPLTVIVIQAPCSSCTLAVTPSGQTVPVSGGSVSFSVASGSGCNWTASSDQPWCSVSPASGSGNGNINATCSPNYGAVRTANITVKTSGSPSTTKTVTVTQPEGCCPHPVHFEVVWTVNGKDTMNFHVVEATLDGINLEPGDEIAVFDGMLCVGGARITSVIDNTHILYIKASRDNGTGNGYTAGHPIAYRFWDKSTEKEISAVSAVYQNDQPEWSTSGTFKNGSTSYISLKKLSTGISEMMKPEAIIMFYPNPTDGKLYIGSESVSLRNTRITLMNVLGQVVLDRTFDADQGWIDVSGNAKGFYYMKITGYSWSETGKIILR